MSDLSVTGAAAGQTVSDTAAISPFAGVTVTSTASATPNTTATVTLSSTADGALSHLGVGTLSADGATYTVSGSPALVQSALRGLVFTPTLHQVAVGQSVTTGFGLAVSDASGSVTNAATTVVATAADTTPTITDTSGAQAATASKAPGTGLTDPGATSFTPFAYTSVADPDAGASETTAITLAQNGAATDTVGTLSGAGMTKTGVGTYVLAAASPAAESAALEALRFTPTTLPASGAYAGASLDVTLAVSDGVAAPVAAASTLHLIQSPGTPTIDTNSANTVTAYTDTAAAQTTPTYSTTVEAVLNGTTVLYEQTFALPSSDPQVQAAEAQAQTALRSAGSTPGAPVQAASNLATLSSQTSTIETSHTLDPNVAANVTTTFGPAFVGPGVNAPPATDRGYFYVEPGELDVNTNIASQYDVSRTVTTTSTTLLSQKYVVSGSTSTAMPAATLVSTNAAGQGGNAESVFPVYSPDGANLLFQSSASNLVPGVSPSGDVTFIKNLSTGAVTLVDSSSTGVAGNGRDVFGENQQEFSGDGSQVVFSSTSSNLTAGDTNGAFDVFVKTLATGATTLVSSGALGEGNANSFHAAFSPVSGDNRVLFESYATNLVAGVTSGVDEIYLKNLGTGAVTLVSSSSAGVAGNADSQYPVFTPDGAQAAFYSRSTNLSPGDTDSNNDVYLKNLSTGALSLISVNAAGTKLNGDSFYPQFSPDGTKIAFFTTSTNAGFANPNGVAELVVRDLTTDAVTLVSSAADGTPGNGSSDAFAWSHDGTQIAFGSGASNLVAGDTNGAYDVFVKTLSTGAITLASAGASGEGNGLSDRPSFAPNGSTLAFDSTATNLSGSDANGAAYDIYTVPLTAAVSTGGGATTTGTTQLVSSSAQGVEGDSTSGGATSDGRPVFTADGASVLFRSAADNIVTPDALGANGYPTYDLFLKTLATGAVARVDGTATGVQPNADVLFGSISGDGSSVVFDTKATNLDPRATDGADHVYEKSLSTGALILIAPSDYVVRSAATGAVETLASTLELTAPAVSASGRYVAAVAADPAQNDTKGELVVFDTLTHTAVDLTGTTLATVGSQAFSATGSTLVFDTGAHLVAADAGRAATNYGVYTYNTATGAITLASDTAAGVAANNTSYRASISADGTQAAFASFATNLSPADTDAALDVYVKNLTTGFLTLVDTTAAGVKANGGSYDPSISSDGTSVSFTSTATNLDPRATDGAYHIYEKNLSTGALTLIDTAPDGTIGNYNATSSAVSPDGSKVAFVSLESNLVANDTNTQNDVFVASPAVTTPPANTPPTISGVPATETDPGQGAIHPFATAVVTGTDTGQTFTVSIEADRFGTQQAGGSISGGGFTPVGPDGATFSSTSLAAIQAALRAVSFTPNTADVDIVANIGVYTSAGVEILSTPAAPANTPPAISGAVANQADVAGVAISPFSAVTVTDPDAGQTETVTVALSAAANGTLAGGGFVQSAAGVYSVTAASAAAAQADLRAAIFTPVAGQSSTTGFTLTVSDGQAAATDGATSVVATYTPPPPPASSGGGTVTATSPSVQDGLTTEFQNLERALAGGADALTPTTPVYAAFQAEKLVAAQLDAGQITLAQAEGQLAHLVDGTTAVAVASYGFFTGSTPTAAGLNYLVHSQANATDLNDAYYARFSTENRYINFAVNLATGPGAGASSFAASYGSLSLADATAKAYAAVFGAPADATKVSALLDTLVPDGLGGQETRAAYFAQYGGDGPNGQGTKAAMVGFLLANAVETGAGVYGAATEHYLSALAHGQAPAFGSELALTYGANVNLVGFTPVPDPTVTG